ncbi:hypothetical protein OF83DRAFT_678572 [Amylostereum chailletii]|nr:hypothetical protein OF83DRAFT_678572 [Amylostereum chailletii]
MTTITVPDGLAWVGVSLLSTAFLLQWQSIGVSLARVKAKVDYPRMYATKEEQEASKEAMVFNCKQRAHQNTLEGLTTLYLTAAITAVQYPKFSAAMTGLWTLSRVFYTIGYSTGSPAKVRSFLPAREGYLC